MKNRRSYDAGRFPYALAAFVKRPQAAAQNGAERPYLILIGPR